MPSTVAIDGPAASGKSTVARALAERLGYLFLDTGVMYRAVTLVALEQGIAPDDEDAVTRLAQSIPIDIKPADGRDERLYTVLIQDRDVTWAIRTPAVDANVSQVSAYRGVRTAMTQQQRRIGARGHVVMVGRDIGTVVLPEADLKIYLDATVEERARRRWEEIRAREGMAPPYENVLAAMRQRDTIDSSRAIAPLRQAEDAIVIDSTEMDLPTVIDAVYQHILQAREDEKS